MTATQAAGPRRLLVISAHPDDIEFGVAGTVAKHVGDGWEVTYAIATSGEAGSQDAADDPAEFGALRRTEALAAATAAGVSDVRFLGLVDGTLTAGPQLQEVLARVFRQVRPHRVFTMRSEQLPGGPFINHPDHRAVGIASLDVCLAAGTTGGWFRHLQLQEGLPSWKHLEDIWIYGPGDAEHVEDISGTIEQKMAALACHASQVTGATLTWVRTRFAELGASAGYDFGESFRILAMRR
ncbi:MAG: LmbE family N-acetylglucosaminyl deacetylase [Glaciecola sp.]|jgi:LmbE family N-acetylglucosaminyl deacetylase